MYTKYCVDSLETPDFYLLMIIIIRLLFLVSVLFTEV